MYRLHWATPASLAAVTLGVGLGRHREREQTFTASEAGANHRMTES